MSLASKVTLGCSVTFLFGAFLYDIYAKQITYATLHKGVVKDLARQEQQSKNLLELSRQKHVEEQYRQALTEQEQQTEKQ